MPSIPTLIRALLDADYATLTARDWTVLVEALRLAGERLTGTETGDEMLVLYHRLAGAPAPSLVVVQNGDLPQRLA
jgi:hypothetical protein